MPFEHDTNNPFYASYIASYPCILNCFCAICLLPRSLGLGAGSPKAYSGLRGRQIVAANVSKRRQLWTRKVICSRGFVPMHAECREQPQCRRCIRTWHLFETGSCYPHRYVCSTDTSATSFPPLTALLNIPKSRPKKDRADICFDKTRAQLPDPDSADDIAKANAYPQCLQLADFLHEEHTYQANGFATAKSSRTTANISLKKLRAKSKAMQTSDASLKKRVTEVDIEKMQGSEARVKELEVQLEDVEARF